MAFYRPREAIFAIGAHLCERPEHAKYGAMGGIIGARKTAAHVAKAPANYDAAFQYIDSDLGGYGLYYARTIATMDLIGLASPEVGLPYDAPTPEGRVIAEAFRSAVTDTEYYRKYFDDPSTPVPSEVIKEYIGNACLCQLQTSKASDRELLRDAFLHAGDSQTADARRATLRFLLDVAVQTDGNELDEDTYRQLIYFHAEAAGATYSPRAGIERVARRWRLYQAREYYSYALNRLWAYLCWWGIEESGGGTRPIPLADVWTHIDGALDTAQIAEDFEIHDPRFTASTPIADVTAWLMGVGNVAGTLDDGWDVQAALQEHTLYDWGRDPNEGPEAIPGMLAMLLLVAARLGSPSTAAAHTDDWDIVTEGGFGRLAMSRFFTELRRRSMAGETLGDLACWVFGDYIIRQHERVAVRKLPDDTYRFRRDEDGLRFFDQEASAGMNNSRFEALATSVHELGFVEALNNDTHKLTKDGRTLLDTGDLPGQPLAEAVAAQATQDS